MKYQTAISIIQNAGTNSFFVNGKTHKRLFVHNNEIIVSFAPRSRTKGNPIDFLIVDTWESLIPESKEQRLNRDASNAIKLMLNPPNSSSRAMDKYFEEGEYTERLVQIIKKRAKKNKRLYDLCVEQYPSILAA